MTEIDKVASKIKNVAAEAQAKLAEIEHKTDPKRTPEFAGPVEHKSLDDMLPEGHPIDVSIPTIEYDGVSFALPKEGVAIPDGERAPHPHNLKLEDWLIIARSSEMLRGVDMNALLGFGSVSMSRAYPLMWKKTKSDSFVTTAEPSTSRTEAHETKQGRDIAMAGASEIGAHVGTPWVSAAARQKSSDSSGSSVAGKIVYMVARYRVPYCWVDLERCTLLSPAFIDAVRSALMRRRNEDKITALKEVFELYGHTVPKRVLLGGTIAFSSRTTLSAQKSISKAEDEFSAKVAGKVRSLEAGGEIFNSESTEAGSEEDHSSETVDFKVSGGDVSYVNNVPAWLPTNKDPNNWIVIEREGVVRLLDLLKDQQPELSAEVETIWQRYRRESWGSYEPPLDEPLPVMENGRFKILRSDGRALSWKKKSKDRDFINSDDLDYKKVVRFPSDEVANVHIPYQEVEITQNLKGNAPLFAPRRDNADPEAKGLLWKLVYSGKTTQGQGKGRPIYAIVAATKEHEPSRPLTYDPSQPWPGANSLSLGVEQIAAGFRYDCFLFDERFVKGYRAIAPSDHKASWVVACIDGPRHVLHSVYTAGNLFGAAENTFEFLSGVADASDPVANAAVDTTLFTLERYDPN
ncbi:hypothetical protein SAMN05421759_11610 [Roseivivax lentus]|uniref:MACPF-like domain-containing protein n=1 Tax=Roseivivax lentus TaxID=633194 RepID=A0A1N7PIF3_9RHOB|nr:hypothetical protein [Roseivivax lentus]SIT10297.1 hypothetical protein SAMN05421759_11610 [Roseivivax lentus]